MDQYELSRTFTGSGWKGAGVATLSIEIFAPALSWIIISVRLANSSLVRATSSCCSPVRESTRNAVTIAENRPS
jgi:hypothetical protein